MSHLLVEYPPLRVMQKFIPAEIYHRVRLWLNREQLPVQLALDGFPCLVFVADETAWICIDECHNNLPILAWTHFKISQRTSLKTPVECELCLYHVHAGLIMGKALDTLSDMLDQHILTKRSDSDDFIPHLKR